MALGRGLQLAGLLVATLALAGCGGGEHASAPNATTPNANKAPSTRGCAAAPAPRRVARHAPKPASTLDPAKTYDVTLKTNCGSFAIRLAVKTSPHVTASFADLVRRGYFDGTIFHRIVPGFVIQGGDPTATGTGGPGYTTVDRPPASTRYTPGTVAMAKTQDEPAGTSGSQFFVVTGADAAQLPPDYAVLGRVVRGAAVVRRIGRLGSVTTEQPTALVEIEHATLQTH